MPLQDPAREIRELREELDRAVDDVVEDAAFVLGTVVEAFEDAVADRLGVGHAVGVASGTDALLLALRALGVGEGDEVVVPAFTFFATAEAVLRTGARPVLADVRADTLNLDPEAAAAAVTDRTAALLPVHLYGQMADLDALGDLAERRGLALVEDAAQAIGARQASAGPGAAAPRGGRAGDAAGAGAVEAAPGAEGAEAAPAAGDAEVRTAGAVGDAGCFSFYPTKNLGGWGDGGMVTTDDAGVAARLRSLRDHGRDASGGYGHREVGYNSRLDALQAAVLRVKLDALDRWNGRRRKHAAAYDAALGELPGMEPPSVRPGNHHVYHQYTLRARERDALREHLRERGVGSGVYYPTPLHLLEGLSHLGCGPGDFPVAERAAREVLSLPVFPGLTDGERGQVMEELRGFAGG